MGSEVGLSALCSVAMYNVNCRVRCLRFVNLLSLFSVKKKKNLNRAAYLTYVRGIKEKGIFDYVGEVSGMWVRFLCILGELGDDNSNQTEFRLFVPT